MRVSEPTFRVQEARKGALAFWRFAVHAMVQPRPLLVWTGTRAACEKGFIFYRQCRWYRHWCFASLGLISGSGGRIRRVVVAACFFNETFDDLT